MTYLQAIAQAFDTQRHRHLTGGNKGIIKAIANRNTPNPDDWEWLTKIVTETLHREHQSHLDSIEEEHAFTTWAHKLAKAPPEALHKRLTVLNGQHTGPEVNDAGTRSTHKATANEGARSGFREVRAIERALEIQAARD